MAFSVNTNAGALQALRNLNSTNATLGITQNRINTGLEVASARDGAATFGIAQNLRADIAGLNSVSASLDRALSSIDVALAAGEAVSDLLIDLRELAVAAADTGLDVPASLFRRHPSGDEQAERHADGDQQQHEQRHAPP